jgi:hypothetical protein
MSLDHLTRRALQRATGFELGGGRDLRPLASALIALSGLLLWLVLR